MSTNYDFHLRIEPRPIPREDLQHGFAAELADACWMLGRQWQMGEHQGENAASPVLVEVTFRGQPIEPVTDRPGQFPGKTVQQTVMTPAEAIVEGEPDDWWTLGRRIRIGLAAKPEVEVQVSPEERAALRLPELPEPYGPFSGEFDGRKLFEARQRLGLSAALFSEVPTAERGDHWSAREFEYNTSFPCANAALETLHHEGGPVEWWSLHADAPLTPTVAPETRTVIPTRFRYPGAPLPRWWQIEDAQVDIGGFPPDRSHFATMLLVDLIVSHSNDWFLFPLAARIGDVIILDEIVVTDTFGNKYSSQQYLQDADPENNVLLNVPEDWTLYKITGLEPNVLALLPTAAALTGDTLEEIVLGVDEDANLLWAVEHKADGRILAPLTVEPPVDPELVPNPALKVNSEKMYLYRPSTHIPQHWHPYVIDGNGMTRSFIQARLADYRHWQDLKAQARKTEEWLAPEPLARLLEDEHRAEGEPYHQIEPAAIPVQGIRLERRYVLARRSDAAPVLWVQRQRLPLLAPPLSGLRFDVLDEKQAK